MHKTLLALIAFTSLGGAALAAEKAPAKTKAKPPAAGITEAGVKAAVSEFVDALNSLDDARVLAAISAGDRGALKGRENLIGVVYPKKLSDPKVGSWEKVESAGKAIGALATITVQETDPIEGVSSAKDRTWFLALDGNQLKVSVSSVWLDAGMVREP